MKKLLYVCEADSGGIMEYAIRQSAALANQGVEVHFLCKESFPKERLAAGIVVEKIVESRVSRGSREDISRMANDFRFAQRGTASRECSKFVKIDQL